MQESRRLKKLQIGWNYKKIQWEKQFIDAWLKEKRDDGILSKVGEKELRPKKI